MGYEEKLAKGGFIPPRPKIKSKTIEVKEIIGEDSLVLQRGQRIVDTRIIHDVVEVKKPLAHSHNSHTPDYKTVIVLECVEYE